MHYTKQRKSILSALTTIGGMTRLKKKSYFKPLFLPMFTMKWNLMLTLICDKNEIVWQKITQINDDQWPHQHEIFRRAKKG